MNDRTYHHDMDHGYYNMVGSDDVLAARSQARLLFQRLNASC